MRIGGTYLEHADGSLEVFRPRARSLSYASTEGVGVEGDQKRSKAPRVLRSAGRTFAQIPARQGTDSGRCR
jgi:hypothetical protein